MNFVAGKVGGAFNYRNKSGDYVWGFKLNQSVTLQNVQSGLKSAGFTIFEGAHPGFNYEGKLNGNWYHLALNSIADGELVMEHHFEVSQPSSWAHKKDYLTTSQSVDPPLKRRMRP